MKGILFLALLVLIAAVLGWLKFGNSPNTSTITIDKQEVQQDTHSAVEKVKEAAHKTREEIQEAIDGEEPPQAVPSPDEAATPDESPAEKLHPSGT